MKTKKCINVLGALTALLTIFVLAFVSAFFLEIILVSVGSQINIFSKIFPIILKNIHLLSALGLVLTIVYLFDVSRNSLLQGGKKLAWTFFLLFLGFIAMPIYWWKYIYTIRK